MTIASGQNIDPDDFIPSSAGAADSGKVAKLGATGRQHASFKSKFGCKVYQNSGQSFASGALTYMPFQAEEFDDDTMHDNSTNNTRITVKTAGYYLVGGCINGGAGSVTSMGCGIRLNGTTMIAGGGGSDNGATGRGVHTAVIRHFAVNDYIEFGASANTTASSSGDESTNFWAILLQAD